MTSRAWRSVLVGVIGATLAVASTALGAPAASAAVVTTLTGAQAKLAFVRMTDRTAGLGVASGMRVTARSTLYNPFYDSEQFLWSSTEVVDSGRRAVREQDDFQNTAIAALRGVGRGGGDTCPDETPSNDWGVPTIAVSKAGAGRWERIHDPKGSREAAKLGLLHREHARWERIAAPRSTMRGLVVNATAFRYLRSAIGDADRFVGGTATPTAHGVDYVINYVQPASRYSEAVKIRMTASVGADGGIRTLTQMDMPDTGLTTTSTYTLRYGKQPVALPARAATVPHFRMVEACHALKVREGVPYLAEIEIASWLNGRAGGVTVKAIRSRTEATLPEPELHLNVTYRTIEYGVAITGRHKLLKHPVVWTVFLRHGKAVAHRVR